MDKVAGAEHHDVPWKSDVTPAPNHKLLRYVGSRPVSFDVAEEPDVLVPASELPHGSDFP